MSRMDPRLEELAALDAVGALAPDETAELRARWEAASGDERARVSALYDAAATSLASTVAPEVPSPDAGARLAARLADAGGPLAPAAFSFILAQDSPWQPMGVPGVTFRVLAQEQGGYSMLLVRGEPGAVFPPHRHSVPEQCYVVSGDLFIAGRRIRAGDFHRAAPDTDHGESSTEGGCLLVIVAALEDYA